MQAALAEAATPIRFDALIDRLMARFPAASPEQIHTLLVGLVD